MCLSLCVEMVGFKFRSGYLVHLMHIDHIVGMNREEKNYYMQ